MILTEHVFDWPLFALIAAVTAAAVSLISEYAKVKAMHLMFWLRIFAVGILLPWTFVVPLPPMPAFYVLVAFSAVLFTYSDLMRFGLAAKNGAGVVTRIEPLIVIAVFILWTGLHPSLLQEYFLTPLRSAGIMATILAAAYFAMKLRHCPVSLETLKYMALPILGSSIGVIISKISVDMAGLVSGAFYYTFFQGLFMLLIYTVLIRSSKFGGRIQHFGMESSLFGRNVIIAGALAGVVHIIHMGAKYTAFFQTVNPAYVSMIGLTAPLMIAVFYKLSGWRKENIGMAGYGIVVCAFALVYLTR